MADVVFGESPLPDTEEAVFSLCPHVEEETQVLSGASFKRALTRFMTALPS